MDKLDVILLIGRPAAGKSETIDFLKQLPDERRLQEDHIAPFEELDDFLYVWQTFEDDNIREHMGLPRRDTDANLYFLDDRIWDFFIERIDLDFRKKLARDPLFLEHHTVMMEFARGGENGFANAFQHLSDDVLSRATILYIDVSFEESLRKNRRRYRPEQADSILIIRSRTPRWSDTTRTTTGNVCPEGMTRGSSQSRGTRSPLLCFTTSRRRLSTPSFWAQPCAT